MTHRDAAVSIIEALASGGNLKLVKGRVVATNTGPPHSVDVKINDKWTVPNIRYLASYASPTVDDSVYVLVYGDGKRIVIGEEQA